MQLFLRSAARVDPVGIEQSLDQGFALGSFEHVVDSCLFPTLEAIGEGWLRRHPVELCEWCELETTRFESAEQLVHELAAARRRTT